MLRRSTLKAKDNEAEGDARQEVVVTHSTVETGEPDRRDPGEGRGHRKRGLTEGNTMGTQGTRETTERRGRCVNETVSDSGNR